MVLHLFLVKCVCFFFWGGSETSALRNAGGHASECYGALRGGGWVKIVNFCVTYFLNGPSLRCAPANNKP